MGTIGKIKKSVAALSDKTMIQWKVKGCCFWVYHIRR